jgi:hypothetical protein
MELVRRQRLVLTGLAVGVIATTAIGFHRLVGYYTRGGSVYHFHLSVLSWFGLDLFVLLIAAGWVVVPGACLGFAQLLKGGANQKAFAVLSLALVVCLLAVAAPFGPAQGRVYERYFFYVAPLLAVAFVWSVESLERTPVYSAVAYAAAAVGLLLPTVNGLRASYDDMSPTLLGLGTIGGSGTVSTLLWASGLAAAAAAAGLRFASRRFTPLLAVVIAASVGAMGTESLLGFGTALGERLNVSSETPRLHAPPNSAIVTSELTNRWLLMKTLFWNPTVTRVLVLGGGSAADTFPSTSVRLQPGRGLVGMDGQRVSGPFALDTDTAAAYPTSVASRRPLPGVFARSPSVFLFGLNRVDGYLETVSSLEAVAPGRPLRVTIQMTSDRGQKTMSVTCGRARREVVVGSTVTSMSLLVAARSQLLCRIGLVKGAAVSYANRTVSVRARLFVRLASPTR